MKLAIRHETRYSYDSTELPVNSGKSYPEGNMGHRPGPKGGYFSNSFLYRLSAAIPAKSSRWRRKGNSSRPVRLSVAPRKLLA